MTITLVGHEPPRLDYSTQTKLTYSLRNDLVLAVFNFLYCCFLRIAPQFFLFLSSSKTTPKKFQNAARGSELGVNTQLPIVHRSTHTHTISKNEEEEFSLFLSSSNAMCRVPKVRERSFERGGSEQEATFIAFAIEMKYHHSA